ncbi:maleylpyruvate isomerase family mycothiol-dependent enzyme [Actinocrispum wychmicini]|uniref:Uncharacterized protein (TIGR03083 family) n=1 Tax=Actinocrispum wychmicini TaxID=1213861 RepID=A0A4R2JB92_9PSEU|nr:maleylpyruvate isomerase family mycothiol-dependent enzyme [Actinocrispum wychmicini]TCO55192.1 uncharacterized protein (TIGR03083 family) [Actinocrispum wychmicini]
MDRERSWQVIESERLSLADLLDTLTEPEWDRPSLCAGWRVRDVAAHVALAPQPPGPWTMLAEGVRARGSFHRLNHDISVRHADRAGADLVAELRTHAASRRLPPMTNHRNILFDILVHGQDIAIPLSRDRTMPLDAARTGAARVWAMGWPFWARRRLAGIRLRATDIDWTAGHGPHEVRGPIDALLLLLTGRAASLDRLRGDGVATLTAHLARNSARSGYLRSKRSAR